MEISQYLTVFMDECGEHLQTLNQALLELENDQENAELLNTIFRAAHTLKGASMTMGFNKMSALTSAMEDVLSALRNKEISISPEVVSLLFESFDLLEVLAQGIGSGREEDIEIGGVTQQLRRLVSGEEAPAGSVVPEKRRDLQLRYTAKEKEVVTQALEDGAQLWHVTVNLSGDCLLKGARAFMVLRELSHLGEVIKSVPESKDLEDEKFQDVFLVGLASRESPDDIVSAVRLITDVAGVTVDKASIESVPDERRVRETTEPAPADIAARAGLGPSTAGQTVRVEIRKLDDLMNLVGELVISRSRLDQLCAPMHSRDVDEVLEQVARLTLDLQSRVLKTRMVPMDNVFRRFPRLVRDLCKETGKERGRRTRATP